MESVVCVEWNVGQNNYGSIIVKYDSSTRKHNDNYDDDDVINYVMNIKTKKFITNSLVYKCYLNVTSTILQVILLILQDLILWFFI